MTCPKPDTSIVHVSKILLNGPLILKMRLGVLEWSTGYTHFSLLNVADAELLTTEFAAAGGMIKVKQL